MNASGVNDDYYLHQNYQQQSVQTDVIPNVTSANYVSIGGSEGPSVVHPHEDQRNVNERLQQQIPMAVPNGIIKNQLVLTHDSSIVPLVMDANRQKQQTMPPTPPGEPPSADEKDQDEENRRRILLNMIPSMSSGQTSSSMTSSLPPQYMNMPFPPNVPPSQMMMQQQTNNFQVPHAPTSSAYFNPIVSMQEHLDDEIQDELLGDEMTGSTSKRAKRRNNKRAVSEDDKDDRYFERRKRNNLAAKRSRDARKVREEHIGMRASFLEKENAMLHAQLSTLREEANALRQLLNQRTMSTPPNHQHVPVSHQGMPPVAHQGLHQQ